ncbi:MAG: hypothetical protein RL367_2852 [Pseudomonadota bacterium]
MRTVAAIFPVPDNTVFTVQVKEAMGLQDCQEDVWGLVTKWEFVNADQGRTEFPDGFDERYDALVWQR